MSANIITFTEQFDNAVWTPGDANLVVTPNTFAPPAFAGILAGQADDVADVSPASAPALVGTNYSIPADTSTWVGSIFVRKDAINTRWPTLGVVLAGGSGQLVTVNMDTSSGAYAAGPFGSPAAFGVMDVDSLWWRLWAQITNDGTNNLARLQWWPSILDALGGSVTSAQTGSATFWGANMTNDGTPQTYQPDPTYAFILPNQPFFTTIGAKRF